MGDSKQARGRRAIFLATHAAEVFSLANSIPWETEPAFFRALLAEGHRRHATVRLSDRSGSYADKVSPARVRLSIWGQIDLR